MKLTPFERLTLITQFQILKAVAKDPHEVSHLDEWIQILQEGHEIFYGDVVASLYDDMPEEDARFVFDVLDMYSSIERYKREHPEDAEVAKLPFSQFRGFDGNNETSHMGFVHFLIKTQRKWTEFAQLEEKTDGFNSHMPTLDIYGPMVSRWRSLGKGEERFNLTHEKAMHIIQGDKAKKTPLPPS